MVFESMPPARVEAAAAFAGAVIAALVAAAASAVALAATDVAVLLFCEDRPVAALYAFESEWP
jgi:hypothetical protein